MTFDNVNELRKVKKLHPNAQLILRMSTDDKDSICQFSQKFGAARSDWCELIITCRELNLNLIGVSFHVGSGCRDVKQACGARFFYIYHVYLYFSFLIISVETVLNLW